MSFSSSLDIYNHIISNSLPTFVFLHSGSQDTSGMPREEGTGTSVLAGPRPCEIPPYFGRLLLVDPTTRRCSCRAVKPFHRAPLAAVLEQRSSVVNEAPSGVWECDDATIITSSVT